MMGASIDAVLIDALAKIERSGLPVDRVSKATLRANPWLDGLGRALIGRGLHGVRCFERRLRWQLSQVGLPQSPALRWAAYRVDVLGEDPPEVCAALDLPGARVGLERLATLTWPKAPLDRLCTQRSLPTWVARRWLERYGEVRAHALAAALSTPGPITLRAARRMGGRSPLRAELSSRGVQTEPTRYAHEGLRAVARFDIRGDAAWTRGAFEVQDEGSQLIAAAVNAQPGERVLDLCAGSGGKTLALADHMGDDGELLACDVDAPRLADLRGRSRRRGLRSIRTERLPFLAAGFDRVLVDAPCSALGTWRRGPDRRWRVLEAEIAGLARLQGELLDDGYARTRKGGRILYATCTLLEAENQANARAFEARHPRLERVPCLPEVFGSTHEIELTPDEHGTDGFYIAAWVRA